jgi:Fe-S-cluster-containing hydrogenase component 2
MKRIIINEAYCPKNHRCPVINSCPQGAIIQKNPFSAPSIDEEKCTACGLCARYCQTFTMTKD